MYSEPGKGVVESIITFPNAYGIRYMEETNSG